MRNHTEAVCFNNININAIETNAGVFIGYNHQYFWSAHSKRNEGVGDTVGRNIIYKPNNYIIDNDLFDQILRMGAQEMASEIED